MICDNCRRKIKKYAQMYKGRYETFCEYCGDDLLIYSDEVDDYVLKDSELRKIDDALADTFTYTKVKNKD